MKLYVHPISSNARRPMMVAKLTRHPVEVVVVDLMKREHLTPEFLALNPNHKVPTLVDGDLHLWESGAICQYIAAKAGRSDLWPTEPAAQADVSRWMLWNHSQWSPPIASIGFEKMFKKWFGQGEPDEAVIAAKLTDFGQQAAILDAHLASREWVAQGHLTLADIQLGCALTYAHLIGLPISDYPHVAAWFARIKALPAWQETELPG